MQEIYSIKLPDDPKLGEGKPENQNHAIIFTRGNAVQTIDMNQVIHFFSPVTQSSGFLMFFLGQSIKLRKYSRGNSSFWSLVL